MDYILELNSENQLVLPTDLINNAQLKPGSHFEAKVQGGRVYIEQLPFSSLVEGKILDQTIAEVQHNGVKI